MNLSTQIDDLNLEESSHRFRVSLGKTLTYALLILLAALMLLPFFWMLSASVKLNKDVFRFPIEWIPSDPQWKNYETIWTRIPFLTLFTNTFKLTVIITLLQLATSSFAAYAFAKLKFKGRDFLFLAYIGSIAIPWQVYLVPQFIMMRRLDLVIRIYHSSCCKPSQHLGYSYCANSLSVSPMRHALMA